MPPKKRYSNESKTSYGKRITKKGAARKKVKFDTRFVEQGGYKGDVMLYPKSFLDEYFGGGTSNGNNKQMLYG